MMGSNSSTSVSHTTETKLINSDYAPVNFRCGGKTTTNISTHTYSLGSPTAYYNQDLYSYSDNYGNRNSGITHTFGVKSLSLDISQKLVLRNGIIRLVQLYIWEVVLILLLVVC